VPVFIIVFVFLVIIIKYERKAREAEASIKGNITIQVDMVFILALFFGINFYVKMRICIVTETKVRINPTKNIIIDALRNLVFQSLNFIRSVTSLSLIIVVAHTVHVINEQKTADNKTHTSPKTIRIAAEEYRMFMKRTIARSIDSTTLYNVRRVEALESRTPS